MLTDPAETGAVTLALPEDVQAEAFDVPEAFLAPRTWTVYRQPPAPEALARAVELVRGAQRPLIVAGGGVIYSEATAALRAFVDATGIPVAETQAGRGALRLRASAVARRASGPPAPRRPTGSPAMPTSSSAWARAGATSPRPRSRPSRTRACASSTSTSRPSTRPSTAACRWSPTRAWRSTRCARRWPAGAPTRPGAPAPPSEARAFGEEVARLVAPRDGRAAAPGGGHRRDQRRGGGDRRRRVRGGLVPGRPAQALARARPRRQGLPRRVRLLVHGLRDPGRDGGQARRARARRLRARRRRLVSDDARRAGDRGRRGHRRSSS